MSLWWAERVHSLRWILLLLVPLMVLASAYGVRGLSFTSDYRAFFNDDNPQLEAYEALKAEYAPSDNVLIVLAPEQKNIFTPEVLSLIEQITSDAWQVPYSQRVDSITNFQNTSVEGDDLLVENLISGAGTLSVAEIAQQKKIALADPVLVKQLISPSGHVTGINITVRLPGKHLSEGSEVIAYVREMVGEYEQANPDIDFHITGLLMLNNAFAEAAKNDLSKLMPLVYLLILVCLALLLKSLSSVFISLLVIVFSVIVPFGIIGWFDWQLAPPAVTAPTIILTIAVADCIHLLVSFFSFLRNGENKQEAVKQSIKLNFSPIVITSITTMLGFLSMNFSEVPPYRDLGNIVAIGTLAAMCISLSFLPAFLMVLPIRSRKQTNKSEKMMTGFANWVITYRKGLLVFNFLLALVLVSFLPFNKIEDRFVENFDRSVDFRVSSDFVSENLTGVYTIEYSIGAGGEGGINSPAFLKKLDAFAYWLRSMPEVIHVKSITDTYKRLNKNLNNDENDWYRLPEDKALASQYLLLYEMSLPYGLDLTNQINLDKSATRMVVTFDDLSTQQMLGIESRISQWWEKTNHEAAPLGASTTLIFSHITQKNMESLLAGAALALVLISLILMVALKSLKFGLISLIPNIIPAAMAFGIWGLLVGEIGIGLSVVVGMSLGIIVDDTVHFLSKYLRARRELKLAPEEAVRFAFSTVGVALWTTSIILVLGFTLLSFSSYTRNADMGLMTAMIIGLALFVDFLLLPPLLLMVDKESSGTKKI